MFSGFNLQGLNDDFLSGYIGAGESFFNQQKKYIQKELDSFILDDESIDGAALQNDWFPEIEADIFLSHSHGDQELAMAFAAMLKEHFGLTAFIDSCVWGYADNLLRKIDDVYCRNEKGDMYDYGKRNFSTSHVHMMLSNALTKMMDKAECLIFINTPNSITTSDVVKNKTKSPWIYNEIHTSYLLRKNTPERHKHLEKSLYHGKLKFEKLDIVYDVKLDHLNPLSTHDLAVWRKRRGGMRGIFSAEHALDILYDIKGLIEYKFVNIPEAEGIE
ncbi:toll/interleukin-1 receptor domain-containing protein [Rossellomorea vietnamensis]|uniref:toll/interleukin-1 receptor domain-containing protein n=1 Tax=Rossellomorea vietnamensis TaxID=218284 RepID=UPI00077CC1E4|nr:toll/interleukin-1 receptor domain-containing protein [Rossellomorea vietnamensis]